MDNKEDFIMCPACGKKMEKVYMSEQNVYLDVCINGCGGIFFDNNELKKFDEKNENISELVEIYKDKEFKKVNGDEDRICPVCGWKMVKHYASTKHELLLDECYDCGGIFLDYNELTKMREQYDTEQERADDVMREFESTAGIEMAQFQAQYDAQTKYYNIQKSGIIYNFVRNFMRRTYEYRGSIDLSRIQTDDLPYNTEQ